MQTTFTIGAMADEFGVTLRTLRFYEDKGLLHPNREGQNRLYGKRDRSRLRLILLGKRIGLSLNEIKEMLSLYELREGDLFQLQHAATRFEDQIALLKRHRDNVEQAIDEMARTLSIVSGMLKAQQTNGPDPLLEAAE
jgi:DNA-binding transcriptional MerR regulator